MRKQSYIIPMILFGIIWAGSFAYAVQVLGVEMGAPLLVLGVYAVVAPLVCRLLLMGSSPIESGEQSAPLDIIILLVLLAAAGAYVIYGPAYMDSVAASMSPDSAIAPHHARALGKVFVFVALPLMLYVLLLGHRMASFGWHSPFWRMFRPRHILVLLIVGGGLFALQFLSMREVLPFDAALEDRQVVIGVLTVFAWILLEIGLAEEFFFRAVVQSRLAVFLRSEWFALVLVSILFGLSYVPGMMEEGGSFRDASAYAILLGGTMSLTYGYIWMRTRNLLILVLFRAAVEIAPNYDSFAAGLGIT